MNEVRRIISEEGWALYMQAKKAMQKGNLSGGCCEIAAQCVQQRLSQDSIQSSIHGPCTLYIDNPTLAACPPPSMSASSHCSPLKYLLSGGHILEIQNHHFVIADNHIIDCSLPDFSRPQRRMALQRICLPINDSGMFYLANGCRLIYSFAK